MGVIFLVVSVALVGGCLFWLSISVRRYKRLSLHFQNECNKLTSIRMGTLLVDLEMATSSQLLQELRKRPDSMYIMLIPRFSPAASGLELQMEVHNIEPLLATEIMKNGYELASHRSANELHEQ